MIITLSRQFAAGARTIGTRLEHRLGYPVLDTNIHHLVGQQLQTSDDVVSSLDERLDPLGVRMLHSLAVAAAPEAGIVQPAASDINADEVERATRTIIAELASSNSMIIVGRGARWILGNRPDALHIRLVAAFEIRVARAMDKEGLDRKTAERLVRTTDRARAAHIERYYGVDWKEPENYDMVLNTGEISIELATDLIVQAAGALVFE